MSLVPGPHSHRQTINIFSVTQLLLSSSDDSANVGWHHGSPSSLTNVSWCPAWCQPGDWSSSNIVTASGWYSDTHKIAQPGNKVADCIISDIDQESLCHEVAGHCSLSSYQLPQNVILRFNAGSQLLTSIVINTMRPLTWLGGILLTFCLKL